MDNCVSITPVINPDQRKHLKDAAHEIPQTGEERPRRMTKLPQKFDEFDIVVAFKLLMTNCIDFQYIRSDEVYNITSEKEVYVI